MDNILLRMNLLGGMDAYVRENVVDDDLWELWLAYGVPDDCDEDLLYEIACMDSCFYTISHAFGKIMNRLDGVKKSYGKILY